MHYINPNSTTALGVVFTALAIVCVTVRFYGWHTFSRNVEIDDILIIPATVSDV